jgi:rubredoxin
VPDEYRFTEPRPPAIVCPKCGATNGFRIADVEPGNKGGLVFLLGGLLPYLLYRSSNRNMLICTRCHYVFEPQAPANPIVSWSILGLALIVIVLALAESISSR